MNDDPHLAVVERIEAALDRIERAAARHASESRTLSDRHAALRSRVGDAIGALDSMIAREADAD